MRPQLDELIPIKSKFQNEINPEHFVHCIGYYSASQLLLSNMEVKSGFA